MDMPGSCAATMTNPELQIYPTPESLARAAAERFVSLAGHSLTHQRRFRVALAGGSTPRLAYQEIVVLGKALDWNRIHLFWGDERCVPPDHPESNYAMARQALIEHLPIPVENIHRVHGELPVQAAAHNYCQVVDEHFGRRTNEPSPAAQQCFDLVLLGLGEDGHTASLFPNDPPLQETEHWVVGVPHHLPPEPLIDRVTLTLPAINAAHEVIFLVSGTGKATRLAQVLGVPTTNPLLPAVQVQPASGKLAWLVDAAAARDLPGRLANSTP
jgi:6-phosphogluconolactonase